METWLNRPDPLDGTFCDRDDPYVRDECMETRLNRPDRLTKHSVTETILTLEKNVWKPGLIVRGDHILANRPDFIGTVPSFDFQNL